MNLRLLSLAEADLLKAFRFFNRQRSGLGWYFLETLYSDVESLRLYAGTHAKVFSYHRMLSKRFPFAIYYDITESEIRVWRILDCRRSPEWIERQLRSTRRE